jgi:hypothetical protein
MGRMEEEKQNNSINCYPHHLHFPFPLKALLCLLGYLGLHPRLYACMYVRMYTVLTERPLWQRRFMKASVYRPAQQ